MCSKCYKEREEQSNSKCTASAIENLQLSSDNLKKKQCDNKTCEIAVNPIIENINLSETLVSVAKEDPLKLQKPIDKPVKKQPIKCKECNKRVGIYGFDCRCGLVFCGEHRYSDKHNCTYDYKTAAKVQLIEANPQLVSAKINKI